MISSVPLVNCHEPDDSIAESCNAIKSFGWRSPTMLTSSRRGHMLTCWNLSNLCVRWREVVQGTMCGVHSCQQTAVSWRMASQS